jgi:hypothetical protein
VCVLPSSTTSLQVVFNLTDGSIRKTIGLKMDSLAESWRKIRERGTENFAQMIGWAVFVRRCRKTSCAFATSARGHAVECEQTHRIGRPLFFLEFGQPGQVKFRIPIKSGKSEDPVKNRDDSHSEDEPRCKDGASMRTFWVIEAYYRL